MTVKERPKKRPARRSATPAEPPDEGVPLEPPGHALLWGDGTRAKRGPKPGLDLERIARAAIEIADAEGLAAVSMQRVAQQFQFTTMSLYRYVSGKAELIALMTDLGVGEPPRLEGAGHDWRSKLEAWTRALAASYAAHPWVLEVTSRLRVVGPNELGWMDAGVDALLETGLSGSEIFDALLVLLGHVRTVTQFALAAQDRSSPVSFKDWESGVEGLVRAHVPRFPALLAAIELGAFSKPDSDGWEFGLRCILDGIGARIRERAER